MFTAILLCTVPVILFLVSILYVIWAERRLLAEIQGREGPSILGFFGVLQTLVDGIKTFFKAVLVSRRAFKILFFVLPSILLVWNIAKFLIIPLSRFGGLDDFEYDLLFINLVNSVEVFVFVFATWCALSSKFPTVSAFRGVAQECATEVLMGFCFIVLFLYSGTLSIRGIIDSQQYVWYVFVVGPYAFIYYLAIWSELHRTPIDVAEAESELTAGYQSEHGGILFSLFYLSEYSGIIVSSVLLASLFWGGWFLLFALGACWVFLFIKAAVAAWSLVVTRATLPRVRVKTISLVFWSHLIPTSSSFLLLYLLSGFITAAFRICEYAVFGIEYFRWFARRFYIFNRDLWYFKPAAALDFRLDTSVGAFLWGRQHLDWGDLGQRTHIDATEIPVSTYPLNNRLNVSLPIAGTNAVLAGRHAASPFDAECGLGGILKARPDVVGASVENLTPAYSFVNKVLGSGIRMQELLAADEMRFREISRDTPMLSAMSPAYRLAWWRFDNVDYDQGLLFSDCGADAAADPLLSGRGMETLGNEFFEPIGVRNPVFAILGDSVEEVLLNKYGAKSGRLVELLALNLATEYGIDTMEAFLGHHGARFMEPTRHSEEYSIVSPSGWAELVPLFGLERELLGVPEAERYNYWLNQADMWLDYSYENLLIPQPPFQERAATGSSATPAFTDPSVPSQLAIGWLLMEQRMLGINPADLRLFMGEGVLLPSSEYSRILKELGRENPEYARRVNDAMQLYAFKNNAAYSLIPYRHDKAPDASTSAPDGRIPTVYATEPPVEAGMRAVVEYGEKPFVMPKMVLWGCADTDDRNNIRGFRKAIPRRPTPADAVKRAGYYSTLWGDIL